MLSVFFPAGKKKIEEMYQTIFVVLSLPSLYLVNSGRMNSHRFNLINAFVISVKYYSPLVKKNLAAFSFFFFILYTAFEEDISKRVLKMKETILCYSSVPLPSVTLKGYGGAIGILYIATVLIRELFI